MNQATAARPCSVGLFAGIGGIELGLERSGFETKLLCEYWEPAVAVIKARFDGVELHDDVRTLGVLLDADVVSAGFPCQDLSQAGRTAGINGEQSGLVEHVFRLISGKNWKSRWLVLENVPFMLQLDRGGAMSYLTHTLEELGFAWAYRVIDARAFGLPQRRQRVILVASRDEDPRPVLFGEEAGEPAPIDREGRACGFYWTEGLRGLGWAVDSVPTLKGGSGLGIPSPPAIWMPDGQIGLPHIEDAERLQGFAAGWTEAGTDDRGRSGNRWKLVGNAVSVPVAEWLGRRLLSRDKTEHADSHPTAELRERPWPKAGYGVRGRRRAVEVSPWPTHQARHHLLQFLAHPLTPLSERATAGFLSRTRKSSLRFPEGFITAVENHLASYAELPTAA